MIHRGRYNLFTVLTLFLLQQIFPFFTVGFTPFTSSVRSSFNKKKFLSSGFVTKTITPRALSQTSLFAMSQSQPVVKESTKEGLKGTTVFLTGATGGLGTALALQLAECGVSHLILSARKADALGQVAASCTARRQPPNTPMKVTTIPCDLSDAAQVKQVASEVASKYGPIDVLINNGGVSSRSSFLETDLSVDEMVMQINFLSGAAFCKALIPGMVQPSKQRQGKNGRRVIWISSVQGLVGIPNRSSYAASKFAVQGYTESIRAELQSSGVSVHTVSPGYINTNLSNSALTGDGTTYGQTDATTAAGADPTHVAVELLDRIVTKQEVDFTIAATFSAVAAIYLRTLCPGLLRNLLVKRFEKSNATTKVEDGDTDKEKSE